MTMIDVADLLQKLLLLAIPRGVRISEEVVASCDFDDHRSTLSYKIGAVRYELQLKKFEVGVVNE